MNQIDVLNAMAGVAVAEVAAKAAMVDDGDFILYKCALAGADLMGDMLMTGDGGDLLRMITEGNESEVFDKILTAVEESFSVLELSYGIMK